MSDIKNELHGYYLEDLRVGQTAVFGKTFTHADILMFSAVSGDTNPLHLNKEFAAETQFKGRIVHGMLTASLISTLVGTKLPGPGCIYMGQSLKWIAPVRSDDTVLARVTVSEIDAKRARVSLMATCTVAGKLVLEGQALVKVPRREAC